MFMFTCLCAHVNTLFTKLFTCLFLSLSDPTITNFAVTPPTVAVLESTCLDSQPHDNFTLVCTARKPSVVIPELGVQWLHNGTVRDVDVMATENGAFITNTLTVTDAQVNDTGLYQCVATIMIPDSPTVSTDGSVNVVARGELLNKHFVLVLVCMVVVYRCGACVCMENCKLHHRNTCANVHMACCHFLPLFRCPYKSNSITSTKSTLVDYYALLMYISAYL